MRIETPDAGRTSVPRTRGGQMVAKNGGMLPRRSAANFACLVGNRNSMEQSHSEYAVCGLRNASRRGTNSVNDTYFGSHELHGREEVVQASSDRGFGYVLAGFSALVAALSFYQGGTRWPYWLAVAVMFALVAWLMRLSGKDPLRLRFEPERKSYWVARQPPGPAPDSLLNQF